MVFDSKDNIVNPQVRFVISHVNAMPIYIIHFTYEKYEILNGTDKQLSFQELAELRKSFKEGKFDECRLLCIKINGCRLSSVSETTVEYDMRRPEGVMIYTAFRGTILVEEACQCSDKTVRLSWEKLLPRPDPKDPRYSNILPDTSSYFFYFLHFNFNVMQATSTDCLSHTNGPS